jgi:hypothetical protein
MNNTRGAVRNGGQGSPAARGASPGMAAKVSGGSAVSDPYGDGRSGPPSRYLGAFNSPDSTSQPQQRPEPSTPTSTGLIRLTLRKPMGIVFEPMYDPNNPSIQRGVRICDLPRTGAAALSRKLEVGDELLSINDKTMSRLTFDEIMDFIIEADPEEVNLLFRRPRKEIVNARNGVKTPNANVAGAGVKWVDDDQRVPGKKKDKKKPSEKKDKKSARKPKNTDEDETTLQSDFEDERRSKKKGRTRKDPYESESFLDILIDTICANPDNVCRERRRGEDYDYYSDEDDGTFASRDDSTYVTYESEDGNNRKKAKARARAKGGQNRDDDDSSTDGETEDDTIEDQKLKKLQKETRSSPPKESKQRSATPEKKKPQQSGKYEDDGTLETVESSDRLKQPDPLLEQAPPLGLAHHPNPEPVGRPTGASDTEDDSIPAPIKELEYDVDVGADVSVMESLGGPSLLIEKQRQAVPVAKASTLAPAVSQETVEIYGKDYPCDFGFTLEQTILNDPLRFYSHVVKSLLRDHEPEKVRLLDKLLAKYKGREDHLVQKLSVRYTKEEEDRVDDPIPENHGEDGQAFEDAVNKGKSSVNVTAAIKTAKERMQSTEDPFVASEWPDKETKEPEEEDQQSHSNHEGSVSGSDFSGDSIDGTSPAVIAQVSELLNYVYGKTSVPGQIDRVSTIMRAYEGREAVLLELLETKALIKANREKENAGTLPSFLRNSASAQRNLEGIASNGDHPPVTPMALPGTVINDDLSSMSGVSSPAAGGQQNVTAGVLKQISVSKVKRWGLSFCLHFQHNTNTRVLLTTPDIPIPGGSTSGEACQYRNSAHRTRRTGCRSFTKFCKV